MSPLTPSETRPGQARSAAFYALRWLAAAMLLAWTLALVVGGRDRAMRTSPGSSETSMMGAFMAAIGVRCSLSLPTATKAMSWTIGVWLGVWHGRRLRRHLDHRRGFLGLHEPLRRC